MFVTKKRWNKQIDKVAEVLGGETRGISNDLKDIRARLFAICNYLGITLEKENGYRVVKLKSPMD